MSHPCFSYLYNQISDLELQLKSCSLENDEMMGDLVKYQEKISDLEDELQRTLKELGATRGELENLKNKAFKGKDDTVSLQRQVRL